MNINGDNNLSEEVLKDSTLETMDTLLEEAQEEQEGTAISHNIKYMAFHMQQAQQEIDDEQKSEILSKAIKTGNGGLIGLANGLQNTEEKENSIEETPTTVYSEQEFQRYIDKLDKKYPISELFPDLIGGNIDEIGEAIGGVFNFSFAGEAGIEGAFKAMIANSIYEGTWTSAIEDEYYYTPEHYKNVPLQYLEKILEEGVTMDNRAYGTSIAGDYIGVERVKPSQLEKDMKKLQELRQQYTQEASDLTKEDFDKAKKKLSFLERVVNRVGHQEKDGTSDFFPIVLRCLENKGLITKEEVDEIIELIKSSNKEYHMLDAVSKQKLSTKIMFGGLAEEQLRPFLKENGIRFFLKRLGKLEG